MDWSLWLAGDTISSSEWLLEDGAALQKASDTHTLTRATVWFLGGQGRLPRPIQHLVEFVQIHVEAVFARLHLTAPTIREIVWSADIPKSL